MMTVWDPHNNGEFVDLKDEGEQDVKLGNIEVKWSARESQSVNGRWMEVQSVYAILIVEL